MFPVYGHTGSYPQAYGREQWQPFVQHCYPSWDMAPNGVKVDSPTAPFASCPCAYGGNLTYPSQARCNECCSHVYPSSHYSFGCLHPHVQAPQLYFPGGPYPSVYPPNLVPPPFYLPDQVRRHGDQVNYHCCGCLHHVCNQKDSGSPEAEDQKLANAKGNQLQNYTYPILWLPPGDMKDADKQASPKPANSGLWNGWAPLDASNIICLNQEKKEKQDAHSGEDGKMQWHLPLIWMPSPTSHGMPEEVGKDVKEITANPKIEEEPESKLKVIPIKLPACENSDDRQGGTENDHEKQCPPRLVGRERRSKSIPVKELKSADDSRCTISRTEKEMSSTSEKKEEENDKKKQETERKPSDQNLKKHASSIKASKLPPVCLRVDPLPRRKNDNGSSRCSGLPAHQDKAQEDSISNVLGMEESNKENPRPKEIKVIQKEDSSDKRTPVSEISVKDGSEKAAQENELNKGSSIKKEIKVTQIGDGSDKQIHVSEVSQKNSLESRVPVVNTDAKNDKHANLCSGLVKEHPIDRGNIDDEDLEARGKAGESSEGGRGNEMEEGKGSAIASSNQKEEVKKQFYSSETDAAVAIQSVYRGFQARKWEPIKKLKKIRRICEQVGNIREKINAVEASHGQHLDKKEKIVISETIMNLLLELDGIQALHPDVRELRKSVARELVCLEEKLDLLANREAKTNATTEIEESLTSGTNKLQCPAYGDDCSRETVDHVVVPAEKDATELQTCVKSEHGSEEGEENIEGHGEGSLPGTRGLVEPTLTENERNAYGFEDHWLYVPVQEGCIWKGEPPAMSQPASGLLNSNVNLPEESSEYSPMEDVEALSGNVPSFSENIDNVMCQNNVENEPVNTQIPELHYAMSTEAAELTATGRECDFASEQYGTRQNCDAKESRDQEPECTSQAKFVQIKSGELDPGILSLGDGTVELVKEVIKLPTSNEEIISESNAFLLTGVESHMQPDEHSQMPSVEKTEADGLMSVPVPTDDSGTLASKFFAAECSYDGDHMAVKNEDLTVEFSSIGVAEKLSSQDGDHVNNREDDLVVEVSSNAAPETLSFQDGYLMNVNADDDLIAEVSSNTALSSQDGELVNANKEDDLMVKVPSNASQMYLSDNISSALEQPSNQSACNLQMANSSEVGVPSMVTGASLVTDSSTMEGVPGHLSSCESSVPIPASEMQLNNEGKMLVEQNAELRAVLEKLLAVGKEQMEAISGLNGRVKDLERKVAHKRRLRLKRSRRAAGATSCGELDSNAIVKSAA